MKNGFSLIEITIVLTLMGLMLCLAIPNYLSAMDRQRVEATRINTHTLNATVQEYILFSSHRCVKFADMGEDRLNQLEKLIYHGFNRYEVTGYVLNLPALDMCEYSTERGYEGVSSYDLYIKD